MCCTALREMYSFRCIYIYIKEERFKISELKFYLKGLEVKNNVKSTLDKRNNEIT